MVSVHIERTPHLRSKSLPFFIFSFITFFSFFAHAHSVSPLHAAPIPPAAPANRPAPPTNSFVALCYHDVSAGFVGNAFSIRKKDLVDQFEYLKAHYNVVSLQDILDASLGKKTLPAKAVLITVDDGLASFYENVYPLLKTYKFKAVFGVVGKWIEDGSAPDYGFKDTNPKMATWKQLKEMSDSGLVDVVSHTYDMHQGHVFNPQGSQAPIAGFFKYDPATKTYETEEAFSTRVQADLQKNVDLIKKHVGKTSPVVVWPYGAYNALSVKAAENIGSPIQMTLRAGLNNAHNLSIMNRGLIFADMDIPQFAHVLESAFVDQGPLRMIRVDLDSIWKKTEAETEQQLGDLLEQTLDLGANGVLLQAISEGGAAYFPTTHLTVRGDYLNRASHTLRYRARVPYIYARIPQSVLKNAEHAKDILRDLAKFSDIDGVVFEVSSKENLKEIPFESFMTAARSVRPHWHFLLSGQKPVDDELFDYVILSSKQLEKPSAPTAASAPASTQASHPASTVDSALISQPSKYIISLPQDYKLNAAHLIAQGYLNLFYDVNFKGFVPDLDFRNVFSVRQAASKPSKGEAK